MTKHFMIVLTAALLLSSLCSGDVFKHRTSGEVLYGYPTNRTNGQKTRIYAEEEGRFRGKTILIDEYDVKYDRKGRKNNVIVIGINYQDIILSNTVSKELAKTISEGANKGPLCVLLDIDSPGGRGDCMKVICDAIKKTSNCPIIAFISGKKHGGAYSAAAGIALACDKIYIAPDARIGSVSVPATSSVNKQDTYDWQSTFSPEDMNAYADYLAKFAEAQKRPTGIAKALVDRNLEVVEVVTDRHGSQSIVIKGQQKPTEAIVKTWSKATTVTSKSNTDETKTVKKTFYDITLSAEQAIYTKLADKIAASQTDVIEDLNFDNPKIIKTNRVRSRVRKFAKTRDTLLKYCDDIDSLELELVEVEKQFKEVSAAALKNRPTKEDERLKMLQRKMYENQLNRNRRRDRRHITNSRNINTPDERMRRGRLTNEEIAAMEMGVEDTYVDPYWIEQQRVGIELAYVLDDLLTLYSRSIGMAKQYPQALPKDVSLRDFQIKYNTVAAKRDSLGF